MDQVRKAFFKIKEDIFDLKKEISSLNNELGYLRQAIIKIYKIVEKTHFEKIQKENKTKKVSLENNSFFNKRITTDNLKIPSIQHNFPTENTSFKPQNPQNTLISIGNAGVPTDRQTNQQTDRQTQNLQISNNFSNKNPIENVARLLDSLDSLKKEIRIKFKKLTTKELLIFSTLYQLEDEQEFVSYTTLAKKLNLTESSIRDYIGKLLKKEIPIEKTKINNKTIKLSISKDLKKITSLSTILQLIEI